MANGSDLEEKDPDTQFTALHKAAINGHESLLQLLLSPKYNANVNVRNRVENTPLHCASQEGHAACVKFLHTGEVTLLAGKVERCGF